MRTRSLLLICSLLLGFPAAAQLNYTFKASTAAYVPLSTATSLTSGKLWNANTTFKLPLGFNFKFNGATTQTMYLSGSLLHPAMTGDKQSGFLLMSTGLMDRSTVPGGRKPEIRYNTSGSAGSRIFKLEFSNAGFEDEYDSRGELKDSADIQIWLYEGSNIVEYRFGNSDVRYFDDYFKGQMQTGYVRNLDTAKFTIDKFHFLNGTPAAPVLDSTANLQISGGLSAFPAAGQVYRFTPKGTSTGVEKLAAGTLAAVSPTRTQGSIRIRNTGSATLHAEVYGTDGRMLIGTEARPGENTLDLSTLPAGLYILRLTDTANGLTESQRIEKQ